MGRPSPSSGSLRITTGSPAASRTTTSKAPSGSRPSSRATAIRSASSVTSPVTAQQQEQDDEDQPDRDEALGQRRTGGVEEIDWLRLGLGDLARTGVHGH